MNEPLPVSAPDRDIYTVSRLNREVKALLEGSFPLVWVEGEISNLSRPASGHLYFSLKDPQAQIRCALFRGNQRGLAVQPRDGLKVLARARVSLYEGRGDFQLIVESLEDAGEGALRRAFELLKQRLAAEGLFDTAGKKPLPRLPRRIGVVTSPSGAVLHDILTTLRRRFPAIPVLLYPVPVQGEDAPERIAAALQLASARRDCDVLILARGGGSLEDLQAFNDERVARAIHACTLPVVCGVGHETDVTIADFVADARAPTPTAAAELLSPSREAWLAALAERARRLQRRMQDRLREHQQHLDHLTARLVHPRVRLERLAERLAALHQRLVLAEHHRRRHAGQRLVALTQQLLRLGPGARLRERRLHAAHLDARLARAAQHALERRRERLAAAVRALDTLNPLATLARGYAILTDPASGQVLRRARDTAPGRPLHARLAAGQLLCRVERIDDND